MGRSWRDGGASPRFRGGPECPAVFVPGCDDRAQSLQGRDVLRVVEIFGGVFRVDHTDDRPTAEDRHGKLGQSALVV